MSKKIEPYAYITIVRTFELSKITRVGNIAS
jgi:hypothetical protein